MSQLSEPTDHRIHVPQAAGVQPRWQYWLARATPWCVWLYVASLAAGWLLLRLGGDRWWFPTLILFGPRWLCAVPLLVLTPLAGLMYRRMLWPLSAAALIVVGPIMGFCVPWATLTARDRPAIRVLTCNVKGRCQDNEALDELIRDAAPDVVALQGCWHQVRVKWPAGWHAGQYGDLLIASHYPLREFRSVEESPRMHLLSCVVVTPDRQFTLVTLHPQSPHQSFDEVLDHRTVLRPSESGQLTQEIDNRWQDSEEVAKWLEQCGEPRIIAGDLNLPPDSAIYRRFWAGYQNAFSSAGLGFGYTEWPKMRKMRFGMRIDHILSAGGWRPRRCWVGPDVGSDHLPLIADLYWAE
ncbi:MAG: endonuclease/exonuclease/phosphatase family protein [Thermoguttaceae bacterium]